MDNIFKSLEALGFSENESKVIIVLFDGHLLSIPEIAKLAKIPRSSAYDIIKGFIKKGICNEIETSTSAKYEIIDPKVVQDKIEKDIHENYKTRITKLAESFDYLQPRYKAKQLEKEKVDVELIKGFNKHRIAKFLQLWENSKDELLIMTKLEGHIDESVNELSVRFIKNGGKVKTIYEASTNFKIKFNNEWKDVTPSELAELCEGFEKKGVEVRLSDSVFQNMAVFDKEVVFMSMVDPTISRYNRSDIIVKNANYARAMSDYFNFCWDRAKTIHEFKSILSKKQ